MCIICLHHKEWSPIQPSLLPFFYPFFLKGIQQDKKDGCLWWSQGGTLFTEQMEGRCVAYCHIASAAYCAPYCM